MSANIPTMGLSDWKEKIKDPQNNLETFSHLINIDYWGCIQQAQQFGEAYSVTQTMSLIIADVFQNIAGNNSIDENTQLEMLKMLYTKLPSHDNYGRETDHKKDAIENLKNNKRDKVALELEIFSKNPKNKEKYNNFPTTKQLKEIVTNHNKRFHPELIAAETETRNKPEPKVHSAISSKKKTLIPSEKPTVPLKKDFNALKKETTQYVSFIQNYAYALNDLYKNDKEIAAIKSSIDANINQLSKSTNEETLAPQLLQSALLATKLIKFCEKNDPSAARQFSKENVSTLSKLIENFKSFLNKVQIQFTSKATMEKRKANAEDKNTRTQTTKQNTDTVLKSLDKLLKEISPTQNIKKDNKPG